MQRHNLSLDEALTALEEELQGLRDDPNQDELIHQMTPDAAFMVGYEAAIHDLRRFTRPPSMEVNLMIVETPEQKENPDA